MQQSEILVTFRLKYEQKEPEAMYARPMLQAQGTLATKLRLLCLLKPQCA